MIYVKYLILVLLDWLLAILGLVIVPIALLFTPRKATNLPRWAWLWDNDVDGLNGDSGWQDKHPETYSSFFWRFWWLAIRNRTTNFGRRIAGYTLTTQPFFKGNPFIGNGKGKPTGWTFIWVPREAFCFYLVAPWFNGKKCLRIYLGWKCLPDNSKGVPIWKPARCSLVYSISPFATFGL
jgi:hypothetical protein